MAGASAAGRIKHKTAEAALAGLLQRARQYNSDENKLFTVDIVVVFGSFLGTSEELGDLDVAFNWRSRNSSGFDSEALRDYGRRAGRDWMTFDDCLSWPERELRLIMKARKRTIQIWDWDTFLSLAVENGAQFNFKVVFGSPEQASAELRTWTDFVNKPQSAA